jgi:ABC-type lipoprotein release transport system permease subunit
MQRENFKRSSLQLILNWRYSRLRAWTMYSQTRCDLTFSLESSSRFSPAFRSSLVTCAFVGVALGLGSVVACIVPCYRVTQIDPANLLRRSA